MSLHRAMRDLTDVEVLKDARHALRRATDGVALERWARDWGEPALDALEQSIEEIASRDDAERDDAEGF